VSDAEVRESAKVRHGPVAAVRIIALVEVGPRASTDLLQLEEKVLKINMDLEAVSCENTVLWPIILMLEERRGVTSPKYSMLGRHVCTKFC
jgi:hypothetical protein